MREVPREGSRHAVSQALLDFTPQQRHPRRPERVDLRVKLALRFLLSSRHRGMENAATWEEMLEQLNADGRAAGEGGLYVARVRRLQEAAEELLAEENPIASLSSRGVFWAVRPEELEASFRERDKRARMSMLGRGRARRVWKRMLGQIDLGENA